MGKHEIRLRRKMMTSRRIERHKNYAGLMKQHHKMQRNRTIIRWVVYVLVFLMSMMLILFAVDRRGTVGQLEHPIEHTVTISLNDVNKVELRTDYK